MKLKIKKTILLSFICLIYSNSTFAQLFEDFEGVTFPPSGWVVTDNGIGTVQSWVRNTAFPNNWTIGVGSAVSNREVLGIPAVAQDWLITPQVLVPANGQLRFFARSTSNGIQGSAYKVLLSTTTQDVSAFTTTLTTFTELDIANGTMQQLFVPLGTYTGQNVYIAFVHEVINDNGERWILDNIEVAQECIPPSNLDIVNITTNTVDLSWTENNIDISEWEIEILLNSQTPTGNGFTVNSNPYTISGLTPEMGYKFYIKSKCSGVNSSDWNGPFYFNTISDCEPIDGNIVLLDRQVCLGEQIQANFSLSNSLSENFQYKWSYFDDGVLVESSDTNFVFTPNSLNANSFIYLQLIDTLTGCVYNYISKEINIINCTTCVYDNSNNFNIVKSKFIALLNHLATLNSVPNGYTCLELSELEPYIVLSNPAIYNFNFIDGRITFSFSSNTINDVEYTFNSGQVLQDILFTDYLGYSLSSNFLVHLQNNDGFYYNRNFVKNINFCPDEIVSCAVTNPNTPIVKQLFINLLNHLKNLQTVPNGYNCPELIALAPYISEVNPRIYNFSNQIFTSGTDQGDIKFTFSNNYTTPDIIIFGNLNKDFSDVSLTDYLNSSTPFTFVTTYNDDSIIGTGKHFINKINFCPINVASCTVTNPNTPVVKQLFINLINHLITLPSVPDGYTCPELTLLAPYVQPYDPVAIYNFSNGFVAISFSFVNNGAGAIADIQIPYNTAGNTITDINLSNYSDYNTKFDVNTHISDGYIDTNKGYIKNIEFCPDELYCKKHIAIVVDESGSIDEREARKIRAQLKSFIEQQALINETTGTNIHVSLIGLSDSDNYNRPDHVMGDSKLTNSNKGDYLTFINNYKKNRNPVVQGVSPNSDYWKSGLTKALEGNPELVILITDGCQTTNASALKDFIRTSFNNNNGASSNPNAPHLYVIGLDNGFYVDNDTPLNVRKALISSEDPNLNPSLQRSAGENSRVTSFLRTSLKYLMEYSGSEFPVNDKYNFIYRPLDGSSNPVLEMVDYFGATDFDFLSDEPNYIYNGSVRANGCGDEIPLDVCNNCLNFKPIPGKEYIVSAWVKEELKVQVKNYTSGEVHINFFDNSGFIPGTEIIATTSGDIIDDWQRIFKRFTIPSGTHYVEIALVNNSGSIPVYFDDVRIHPVDGSMKSFVYDPETFRLMSELDENNFSTFYEYDNEGGLIRVKKETSRGIKTIQETRSGNVIKVD